MTEDVSVLVCPARSDLLLGARVRTQQQGIQEQFMIKNFSSEFFCRYCAIQPRVCRSKKPVGTVVVMHECRVDATTSKQSTTASWQRCKLHGRRLLKSTLGRKLQHAAV